MVVVSRVTEYEQLLAEHGTREQAAFYLRTRGRDIEDVTDRHARMMAARSEVASAIPREWRRGSVDRSNLDRFLFETDDIVVAVGQDGLVPNVAKYLDGQSVIGVNPDPGYYEGVLVRHVSHEVADLLQQVHRGEVELESRRMVQATLDDGLQLLALNEIFIGHHSHQSARYRLTVGDHELRQISSGLIVSTGTGATGWARSISIERQSTIQLPRAGEARLAFFVREAFPASGSSLEVTEGEIVDGQSLVVSSEMEAGGIVFGDGIESDGVTFDWGRRVEITLARLQLQLV